MYRFILMISCFYLPTFLVHSAKDGVCKVQHCIAVIDAGSSSSRLHIYSYDLDSNDTPIHIDELWSRKIVPGISTIEQEHKSIAMYLEKLFIDAPAVSMPVYFYSTAGMRLLPKSNHKNVNQMVSDWFEKQFYWRPAYVRTISGNEEGVFAWIAVNYQLGLLNQTDKPLVGTLDIGGASVQITLPIVDPGQVHEKDKISINLYGREHSLFAHSFLGLGQNEMAHQYLDLKSCYPIDYELPNGKTGKGDAPTCAEQISILVNNVHRVKKTMKNVLMQNPIETWYLLGGVANMLNDKMFTLPEHTITTKSLLTQVDTKICQQPWLNLEDRYPNHPMVQNYCLLSAYLSALITNGYGVSPEQAIHFMPANKTADWTIGVVLSQHNPLQEPKRTP